MHLRAQRPDEVAVPGQAAVDKVSERILELKIDHHREAHLVAQPPFLRHVLQAVFAAQQRSVSERNTTRAAP